MVDMTATVLAAAGLPVGTGMRGRPLQGLVGGEAHNWPQEVLIQLSNHPGAKDDDTICGRALRTKKWTYTVRAPRARGRYPDSDLYFEDFLYDLEHDPYERNNRVSDPALAGKRLEFATLLERRIVEIGEEEPKIEPRQDKAGDST